VEPEGTIMTAISVALLGIAMWTFADALHSGRVGNDV